MSNFQLGSTGPIELRTYFTVILVVFMFTAAVAFLNTLGDGDIGQMNQAVLGFFSTLLGLIVGAAIATAFPQNLQYGGFWLLGFIISVIFYLALQRWHTTLKWASPSH